MAIKKNAAQCSYCGDIIESKHRHDWVSCSCWDDPVCEGESVRYHGIYVDGGKSYVRHGWSNPDEYENLTEWSEDGE